jgi:hypothetical protein
MEIPVKTVNHGFVTAPLEASLVDQLPPGVRVELAGAVERDCRRAKNTSSDTDEGGTDGYDIPNLGGRDGVSFGALSAISSSFRGLVIR